MSNPQPVTNPAEERLLASQLADSLDAIGLREQVMDADIVPLAAGMRAAGRAVTVRFEPSDHARHDDPYGPMIDLLDSLQPGDVVVAATSSFQASALWGELFSVAATGRAARGLVTNGCTRDSALIRDIGFPIFARGQRPVDYRGRQVVAAVHESVTVGGVNVANGDWVLADDDGIVVVPQAHRDEALAVATSRMRAEDTVRDELLAGDTIRAVWQRHGIL